MISILHDKSIILLEGIITLLEELNDELYQNNQIIKIKSLRKTNPSIKVSDSINGDGNGEN